MFYSMKIEEYMESELSCIFWVKLVGKSIVLGSQGTKHRTASASDISFWKNIQIFWTRLLHHSVFLVKQYTNLIYVKEKSFCLFNWAFSFVGPRGPFHAVTLQKYFMHMRVNKKWNWNHTQDACLSHVLKYIYFFKRSNI